MKTALCIGTGPSLKTEQIDTARAKGWALYGCNNVFTIAPDLDLLYACNLAWWDRYYHEVKTLRCEKWTTNPLAGKLNGVNHIRERAGCGMCLEAGIIHHGHGSGYSLVSMAHKAGFDRVVLVGYDLKYAPDYDGAARQIGSGPRHFFGEYPSELQHFPSKKVVNGVHIELLDLYKSIVDQGLIELINCTPDSALADILPYRDIRDVI